MPRKFELPEPELAASRSRNRTAVCQDQVTKPYEAVAGSVCEARPLTCGDCM